MAARVLTATCVVLLNSLALASDWPTGLLSDFWSGHQIVSSYISSLGLLALSFLVIDRIIAVRASRTRARIFEVARDDLAAEYNLTRRALLQLAGSLSFDSRAARPLSVADSGELSYILDSHFAERFSGSRDTNARLEILLPDTRWLALMNRCLQARQAQWMQVIARWSSPMLSDRVLAPVLLRVAQHNQDIRNLQIPAISALRDRPLQRSEVVAFTLEWGRLIDEYLDEMELLVERTKILNRRYDSGRTVEPIR